MIAATGHYLLVSCITLSALALFWRSGSGRYSLKETFFYVSTLLPIFAFLLLEYAFIISDFSLRTVFFHSSTSLPLIYKIASGWASHESSMLLWFAMLSATGLSLVYVLKKHSSLQKLAISLASFVQLLFGAFILKTSSPFEILHVDAAQGMGMNPMLQDMAVAIHPPILYAGFVSLFGAFLCSLLILLKPEFHQQLFLICRRYSLLSLTMLTAGIGLGSWWAYRELGWGGFWYFDPVENISLLPWISSIILHHYLIFTINDNRFLCSSIFWGIFAFLSTLYGFFFVRSGIISSVHSFAFSPERGLYILIICVLITALSLLLFFCNIKQISNIQDKDNTYLSSQVLIVKWGNIFWVVSLFVLLVAIVYPIYYSFALNLEIAIDPTYYHKIFVPVFIPILLLAAVAPYYKQTNFTHKLLLLIASIILTIPIIFVKDPGMIITLILISSIFLIVSATDYILKTTTICTKKPSNREIAVFLGHFGSGLLALSICINVTFSNQVNFQGVKGSSASSEDLIAKLDNINFAESEGYYRQVAKFNVKDSHGNQVVLKPENRLYKIENSISQEADIFSFITHDLYAVINSVKNKTINAEIHYKPMISFIWLAVLLMSLGFFVKLSKKD